MIAIEQKVSISWCKNCKTPLIAEGSNAMCPLCHNATRHMCSDLRPVFPEERLLIEILLDKPYAFAGCSVWASSRGRYYIDGRSIIIPRELYNYKNTKSVRSEFDRLIPQNDCRHFNNDIDRFIRANKKRLVYIKHEAMAFVRAAAGDHPSERMVVSFSGGKDSTVCADLVYKSLGNPALVYIFGDTTLEYYTTYEYCKRFRQTVPFAIFKTARNNDKDFFEVCRDIGAPSVKSRWCCTMFKTGPISQILSRMYGNKQVITFSGIRANESPTRSKYERLTRQSETNKIQQQIVAAPIFYWHEADVWLYLFSEGLDFNDAYRLGYNRVGCWLCPNCTLRGTFLNQVYFPEQTDAWRSQLIDFAKSLGKPDFEDYVDGLYWTRRHGGDGIKAAADVKVQNIACTTDENARLYNLNKPIDGSFYSLFAPFGLVSPELGRKLIGEVLIVDSNTKTPLISIQPMRSDEYDHTVKIKTLNVKSHFVTQRKIVYQIRKFNACRECGKCSSLCLSGAITLKNGCIINTAKCTRCQKCITAKYIEGGCMMIRALKTKVVDNVL